MYSILFFALVVQNNSANKRFRTSYWNRPGLHASPLCTLGQLEHILLGPGLWPRQQENQVIYNYYSFRGPVVVGRRVGL